ncbi:hypothetical protein ACHAWF_013242 [Thalassiosira exigua]
MFRCHRKDKYGLNMQAICDHRLRFIWYEMAWPAATSDYMAFCTSALYFALEANDTTKKILKGFTFVGDNAYVKKMYMAVPFKGIRSGSEDAYNFYLSQLRITIERAFGVLVHRWAILRAPLTIPIEKVAPMMESLIRLHNFCINEGEAEVRTLQTKNVAYLEDTVSYAQKWAGKESDMVGVDEEGRPTSGLDECNHFADAPTWRFDRDLIDMKTPMDRMLRKVRTKGLARP